MSAMSLLRAARLLWESAHASFRPREVFVPVAIKALPEEIYRGLRDRMDQPGSGLTFRGWPDSAVRSLRKPIP
jgi:hypothetical protein